MSDTAGNPPQDIAAEQAVLGAMLAGPHVADDILGRVRAIDFYRPAHATIYRAILQLRAVDEPCDPVAVKAALEASGEIASIGGAGYLLELFATPTTTVNAGYYADIVRDRAKLRALIAAGTGIVQRAYDPGGETADAVAEWAHDATGQVREYGYDADEPTAVTLDEIADAQIVYDWLIPGLLERGDRVLLTGSEGLGKSTLTRQIAVCAAAGIHPFTLAPAPPRRVLVVDCENGRALSTRRYRPLRDAARAAGRAVPERSMRLEIRPSGLDLAQHGDVRWLTRRVEAYRPDLLAIGPLYRLHRGDPNDEQAARAVAAVLDKCRAVSGCALLMETHSPHGNGMTKHRPLRPIGSSLWLRWPEFGYGLRLADSPDAQTRRLVHVEPWRGPRDERQWPEGLEQGTHWPFVEALPQGFFAGGAA